MTTPKALPPGSNHHAEVHRIADKMQGIADVATKTQTAPRPAGGRATVTAEIPVKSRRSHTAKV